MDKKEEQIYKQLLRSRYFEEKIQTLFNEGALYGTTHLNIGQEASHTGLCNALQEGDWIVPTHRCHGYNIARGSSLEGMFSEMFGSRWGLCKGIGGSMHMTDISTFNAGSSAVVGSGIAIAAGLSFALMRQKKRNIAVAILGDGATSRGVLHECMNLASVWNLPLLFYCENNHYGMSASSSRMIAGGSIYKRAKAYGMHSIKINGNDYHEVYEAVKEGRNYILENREPVFIEADTYRLCGHSKSDKRVYRSKEEEEMWREKDPIELFESTLGLSQNELNVVKAEVNKEVEEAYMRSYASKDDILTNEELENLVYAKSPETKEKRSGMHKATYREAIYEALDEILTSDERATLIGEDVGLYGGCFGVTEGLIEKHSDSVLETPVSEEAFAGLATGAAILDEHPIVEIMYGDFATLISDALINHAAKLFFMSAGQLKCPMVIRLPSGSGTGHGSQHTQSLEGMFLNIPGLKIVAPSDPFTAKALLKEAVKDNNPVLFFEHKALYGYSAEAGDIYSSFPIGKAQVLTTGSDLTLISYSRATLTCRKAISNLRGISVEHIDLATIKPLDMKTIKESVLKTRRVLLVEDEPLFGSVMASLAATLSSDEEISSALLMEIKIIAGKDMPIPFSRELERAVVPIESDIRSFIESLDLHSSLN